MGSFYSFPVLDANGLSRSMRVWDESGTGAGPFTFSTDYQASDGSGSITLGGTAQTLFSNVVPAHGFFVYNVDLTEVLWLSMTQTAQAFAAGSIPLAPMGGMFISPPGMVPFTTISVVAATTGHKFTAVQW